MKKESKETKRMPTEDEIKEFEEQFIDEKLPEEYFKNVKPYEQELRESENKEEYASYQYIKYLVRLSELFKKYRKTNGIDQKKLAKILGVSQPVVSRIESTYYNPSLKTIIKYLTKLDYSLEDLVEQKCEIIERHFYIPIPQEEMFYFNKTTKYNNSITLQMKYSNEGEQTNVN